MGIEEKTHQEYSRSYDPDENSDSYGGTTGLRSARLGFR